MYVRVCLIVYAYIRRLMDGSKSKMQAIDIRSTIKMFCLHRWRHLLDRKDKKKKISKTLEHRKRTILLGTPRLESPLLSKMRTMPNSCVISSV